MRGHDSPGLSDLSDLSDSDAPLLRVDADSDSNSESDSDLDANVHRPHTWRGAYHDADSDAFEDDEVAAAEASTALSTQRREHAKLRASDFIPGAGDDELPVIASLDGRDAASTWAWDGRMMKEREDRLRETFSRLMREGKVDWRGIKLLMNVSFALWMLEGLKKKKEHGDTAAELAEEDEEDIERVATHPVWQVIEATERDIEIADQTRAHASSMSNHPPDEKKPLPKNPESRTSNKRPRPESDAEELREIDSLEVSDAGSDSDDYQDLSDLDANMDDMDTSGSDAARGAEEEPSGPESMKGASFIPVAPLEPSPPQPEPNPSATKRQKKQKPKPLRAIPAHLTTTPTTPANLDPTTTLPTKRAISRAIWKNRTAIHRQRPAKPQERTQRVKHRKRYERAQKKRKTMGGGTGKRDAGREYKGERVVSSRVVRSVKFNG